MVEASRWGFDLSFKGLSSLLLSDGLAEIAEELEPLPSPKPAVKFRPRTQSRERNNDAGSASATAKPPRMLARLPKPPSNNNKRIGDQLRGLKKKKTSESPPAIPVRDSLNSAMARRRSSAGFASFVPAHPPRSSPESPATETRVTLPQDQVHAKMKILMNHPALWAEFKEKLGKHQNANSHGTVRVVMQEFLQEHGDELEDENTLASSSSSLIFNVFAGLTGESSRRLGDEAVMTEMDTYYRTARNPPSRNDSSSSSRSKGRPRLQKGGLASLSVRAMNNLAREEATIGPIIVSDSVLPTKSERPGLQKGGLASLSVRAMNRLAGEEATVRPIIVSDSDLPTKRERPGLQKGGFASLSARAMTRAVHSLAGETMEGAAQKPRRHSMGQQPSMRRGPSMGGQASLSTRNVMAALTNNIANEASQQPPSTSFVSASEIKFDESASEIKFDEELHRSFSWLSSVLPITKDSPETTVPKPSARNSWVSTQALAEEIRIPAQPAQTNAQAPPEPPFGSNDNDLQSVDLNGSSHHKNRHAEVPHTPSSGGFVRTLRRVSLLFSHDIQLELEAANKTQAAASALLDEALTTDVFSHDIQPALDAANRAQAAASTFSDDEALTTDGSSLFHESEASLESVLEEEEEGAGIMLRSSYLIATKQNYHTRDEVTNHNSISSLLSACELSFGETDPIAEVPGEESSSEDDADEGSMGKADTPKEEVLSSAPTLEDIRTTEELL